MRQISRGLLVLVVGLSGLTGPARAGDFVASCNYSFPVGPYEDRGSIQILKVPAGLNVKVIQDDEVVVYPKVGVSTASGDQARDLVKNDGNFKIFVTQAHIFTDEIDHVDEYAVPNASGSGDPQVRFFAFYGKTQNYLGGFGMNGQTPFVCDWVSH